MAAGTVAFKIPTMKSVADQCLIVVPVDSMLVYAYLALLKKEDGGLFVFKPLRIQIIGSARNCERAGVSGGKKIVFVTNAVSDFISKARWRWRKKK